MCLVLPAIYVIHSSPCLGLWMLCIKVLLDPFNQVVLERALDQLVEKIRGQ